MTSKIFAFFLCLLCAAGVSAQSTPVNKVSINTSSQNEILYVNGTVRIQSLPMDGATTGIFTKSDGSVSTAADQPFNATHEVVVDANGVLGRSTRKLPQFFYMPSIVLPMNSAAAAATGGIVTYDGGTETYTINLFEVARRQFALLYPNSTRSPNATDPLPFLDQASKFAYFVTYFDKEVYTNVAVNNSGILTYKVKPYVLKSPKTYMNIILKPLIL